MSILKQPEPTAGSVFDESSADQRNGCSLPRHVNVVREDWSRRHWARQKLAVSSTARSQIAAKADHYRAAPESCQHLLVCGDYLSYTLSGTLERDETSQRGNNLRKEPILQQLS